MTALIPKLLRRLEQYAADSSYYAAATMTHHIQRAQNDIYCIFDTALNRIRGNPAMPVNPNLIQVLLPFINSNNPVVSLWALAFLQLLIPRQTSLESLGTLTIASLIESLGTIHFSLVSKLNSPSANHNDNMITTNKTQWIRVSWLLFDCIMIYSGQKPLKDWEVETFDRKMNQIHINQHDNHHESVMEEASKIMNSSRSTSSEQNSNYPTLGLIALLLDLLIYWPDQPADKSVPLSPLGLDRMNHRSRIASFSTEDIANWNENRRQQQHRHDGQRLARWTDMTKLYLRYMKLACLQIAIWPPNRGIFRGDRGSDGAYLLSILSASHDSMHGRVAIDYLNQQEVKTKPVPLSVVICLVVLFLGEERAQQTLQKYQSALGCKDLIGPLNQNKMLHRPPLPWEITSRAARFLIDNSWESNNNGEDAYMALLVELLVVLCQQDSREHKFLAVRLVDCMSNQFEIQNKTISSIITIVVEVLNTVVDLGVSNLEELRTTPRARRVPSGVPVPFDSRSDLNRLLRSHRQSLKRKSMKRDDAMDARKEAYQLIHRFASFIC